MLRSSFVSLPRAHCRQTHKQFLSIAFKAKMHPDIFSVILQCILIELVILQGMLENRGHRF